jgi:hypothetical protein
VDTYFLPNISLTTVEGIAMNLRPIPPLDGSDMYYLGKTEYSYSKMIQPDSHINLWLIVNKQQGTALIAINTRVDSNSSQQHFVSLCLCDDCVTLHAEHILVPCITKHGTDDIKTLFEIRQKIRSSTIALRAELMRSYILSALSNLLRKHDIYIGIVSGNLGYEVEGQEYLPFNHRIHYQTLNRCCGKDYPLPLQQAVV